MRAESGEPDATGALGTAGAGEESASRWATQRLSPKGWPKVQWQGSAPSAILAPRQLTGPYKAYRAILAPMRPLLPQGPTPSSWGIAGSVPRPGCAGVASSSPDCISVCG